MHLPPPDYWYTCLFLLSGRSRSPTRNCSFSVFAQSMGPCKYLSFLSLSVTSRTSLNVLPFPPCFLTLAFFFSLPFLLLLDCTQGSPWTVSLPGFPYFLPYLIVYVVEPCSSSPFGYFLPYSSISTGLQPLSWRAPYFLSFHLSHVPTYLFLVGAFPVLLLIPYYSPHLSTLVLPSLLSYVLFPVVFSTLRSLPMLLYTPPLVQSQSEYIF